MTPDSCNILVRCHAVSLRRNRRASDYLQDCQRDGQTYAASEVFLERRFASSWIVVRIFNLQSHDASDIEQTSISTNKDGERCLINQCISRGPGLLLPYQTQACRWQTGGQVVLFQPAPLKSKGDLWRGLRVSLHDRASQPVRVLSSHVLWQNLMVNVVSGHVEAFPAALLFW